MNDKSETGQDTAPEREAPFENEPSSLDDNTHKELCILYEEATDTLRFAKYIQWWTVGSTVMVFFAFILIAEFVGADKAYANILTALIIFIAMSGILTLMIYQFWQFNEVQKIEEITKHMSSLFSRVRDIKSKREGNVHRYILLTFMSATIIIGGVVSYHAILQVVKG